MSRQHCARCGKDLTWENLYVIDGKQYCKKCYEGEGVHSDLAKDMNYMNLHSDAESNLEGQADLYTGMLRRGY